MQPPRKIRSSQRAVTPGHPLDPQARPARQPGQQAGVGMVLLQQHRQRLCRAGMVDRQPCDDNFRAEALAGDPRRFPARIAAVAAERRESGEQDDGFALSVHTPTLGGAALPGQTGTNTVGMSGCAGYSGCQTGESPMKELKGKVAVITGGNSGIGLGVARSLAAEGVHLVLSGLHGDKSERAARALADEYGIRAIGVASDASRREEVEALADLAFKEFGHVDMLVANAGVGLRGAMHKISDNDWDWLMGVNVRGTYLACSAFIRRFIDQGRPAHILITGSEQSVGMTPYGSMPIYAASKHALLGLADAIRNDYAENDIAVTLLCPGPVATDIWDIERDRPAQYGQRAASNEESKKLIMELGMDANLVGRMAVEGVKAGDFYVFTHEYIRDLVEGRYREMIAALDKTDTFAK